MATPTKKYITSKEIEDQLQVSHTFVRRHRQEFGGIRLGHRTWRYPPDAVELYLNAHKQKEAHVRHTVAIRQEDPGPPADQNGGRKGRGRNPDPVFDNRDPRHLAIVSRLESKRLPRFKGP